MDAAARAYSPKMHTHVVRNGKVYYKVEGRDEYSPNVVYDYETNADYFAEFDKGALAEITLRPYVECATAQLWLFECIAFSMMPLFIEVQIFKAKAKAARDRAGAAKALV